MSYVTLTKENFAQEVLQAQEPVLVDFWAPWCGPCQALSPVIEEIADGAEGFKVGKVNVDEEAQLAQAERIEVLPTLVLYRNGKAVGSIVAPESKAMIETFIQEALAK